MELSEDEVRAAVEPHVRAVAADVGARSQVTLGGGAVVETLQQEIQQRRLALRRQLWLVLDRVGDAAEQIGDQHGTAERARKNPDAQRKRARDRGQDLPAEASRLDARAQWPKDEGYRF
jgi:hypothetical protein